jgi:hypothetical protein
MTTHEQRDNSGILFRNDKKTRDSDRDYSGSAMIAGVEYWISGWIKTGRNGKFMTFAFKPKHEEKSAAKSGAGMPFDDSIPFAPEWRG